MHNTFQERIGKKNMDIYRIALFGHRDFCATREIEDKLYNILRDLMITRFCVEFYIGRNGEFDLFAASVVKRIKKELDNSSCFMTLVLPYKVKDIEYFEKYYDDVIIYEGEENLHPKAAITKRNEWMVENCDLLVCFVERNNGGAYKAIQYANNLGIKTINLFSD